MGDVVLAVNSGSSSIKIQALPADRDAAPLARCLVERIGSDRATLALGTSDQDTPPQTLPLADHSAAIAAAAAALQPALGQARVLAVAHRIVHGGPHFTEPAVIGAAEQAQLRALIPLAPLHLPASIDGLTAARTAFPDAVQVGCFDTAFHAAKPQLHDRYALPRAFYDQGVRRYGFHGLSCQSVVRSLRQADAGALPDRLVIAHLGNGCSVTGVRNGRGVCNSMGFSTLDGMTMGTRCGRIDPGVVLYLLQQGQTPQQIETLLYRQSGLLGLSGVSNDMRDLEASDNPAAALAIDHFVTTCVQEIARAAAVLGGIDMVAFCGGIGENAADIRARITQGLQFLPPLDTRVVPTDEERELAIAARALLHPPHGSPQS